ncbi:putative bifunctional diguanylate cyclase/phosphodiesterase [Cellulomonas fengjieae]|uniref:putative bifunctional diguanylate cyclase/phosphodiesterase n=1 Tax=Cellulomonas fengjieae TaxID=2819978 RepID=UPI001AAF4712|nr:EAL domain-containing protein [Cellulomonas fengjieae]MBO3102667.1 EAL domain-containing protein [Cellulomonas fengjieae]
MLGSVPTWVTVLQLLAAGLVGGFCALQWLWWRGEVRPASAAWSLAWSTDMALVLLAGGLFALTTPGPVRDALVYAHALLLAGFLIIAIPATRAIAGGPRIRYWLWAAIPLFTAHAVLWWVPLERYVADHDVLTAALLLVPTAVVVSYVVAALGRIRLTGFDSLLVIAGAASLSLFTAGVLWSDHPVGALCSALGSIPLAVGIELLALNRLRLAQDEAARQHRMRDALARLANAAWYIKDADALLLSARDEARTILGDPSVEGSLRPIARDRFVSELYSADEVDHTARARAFLIDLAQIVSAAAERYQLSERLHTTAFTDPLTRLPNRRAVEEHLLAMLERANVERTRVSLAYCDLDGFKRVNDSFGHAHGDALLVRAAEYLRRAVADLDAHVGRVGGDEFVIVVARAPEDAHLVAIAREIREGFVDRHAGSRPARLTVGVATWQPGDIVDTDALIRHADTAMLEAKRSRSGFRVFDRELRQRVEAQRHQRTALEHAVADGRFTAHFQPIVDAQTLEMVQVEALARWQHRGRFVLPAEWLDLAEESGLIVPIGLEILRQARRALERFQMPVSVNLAARQLAEVDALEQIETAWGGAFWEHLTLEITESALIQTSSAIPVLSELRARGARIAVDDFGTGYSSLARMSRLPVDELKIDRSFVRDMGTDRGRGVVRAIVALASTHGLSIVAEGVETPVQLTALAEMGVTRVQGNFLGRPAPSLPVRGPRPATVRTPARRPVGVPQPNSAQDDSRLVVPRTV